MLTELRLDTKALRSKEQLNEEVTRNFLLAIEFVVKKTGPIKTYGQAAKLIALEPGNLTKIQQGYRSVPFEAAVRACDVFGCSYNFMFRNEGEMFGKDDVMRYVLNMEERLNKAEQRISAVENKVGIKSGTDRPKSGRK